ncbi:MAG: DEAD/DEAH box helicase family protein [Bdellovibrionota bacterium]
MMINVYFDRGTILATGIEKSQEPLFPYFKWDNRIQKYRAQAYFYRDFIMSLRSHKLTYTDSAKNFSPCNLILKEKIEPRSHQTAALDAWLSKGSKGVVVLPTGSGKTILAILAIAQTGRPTLIHVPTIDLMHQWYQQLSKYFSIPIGLLGGGEKDIQTITVSTYDSAVLSVPYRGNQFGLLIFDECHHLPSEQMQYSAISSIAPFRLGLTATPESNEVREKLLYEICGNFCFQSHIHQLAGGTLSSYEIITKQVELSEQEQHDYQTARQIYTTFLKDNHIEFRHDNKAFAWNNFIRLTHRTLAGKEAFKAYLVQKKIAQSSKNKTQAVWDIFCNHPKERILIFTQDNETAYNLGRQFFLPVLTHHTKVKEREHFLTAFRTGEYRILITSKVLNEGVDVPEASVAIVFSGSGTVREHVQRLGRILRAKEGKKAVLYEIISANTGEYFINQRRRDHDAYKKFTP